MRHRYLLLAAVAALALPIVPDVALAHGVTGRDAAFVQSINGPAAGPFMYLGAKHMVTGYDHLLFLVGVIVMATEHDAVIEQQHRLAVAAGTALLVAGAVLVMFILPAEFAVDPLGTGARFGLLDLGITGQQVDALENTVATGGAAGQGVIVTPQERSFQQETVDFMLAPGEGMEYKYRLAKGEALLYSWTATGPVNYEFHAEPDGAPRGYAQSYEKVDARPEASGTLIAPFSGIHGWYWQNTGSQPVTVGLTSAGHYNLSHEFRDGAPVKNKMFQ